jgi:ribonuclease P protein component
VRFSRDNRVRLAKEFAFIRQNAKKADCSAFVFYCLPRPEHKKSRLGLVTSKRVGCAVERNKVRRILRAIFRECAPSFEIPCDILVFARRGCLKFEYQRLLHKFSSSAKSIIDNAKK